eukprot:SAG31_NODE_33657_length_341_cov_0.859504_1_plen_82_part_01
MASSRRAGSSGVARQRSVPSYLPVESSPSYQFVIKSWRSGLRQPWFGCIALVPSMRHFLFFFECQRLRWPIPTKLQTNQPFS